MRVTYDEQADALYISLVDKTVHRSQRVNFNCALDMDADGDVIGIEVLNVRKRDLNPYEIVNEIITPKHPVQRPDSAAIREGRIARAQSSEQSLPSQPVPAK
ncbi:MAG: DUF2283 domain-containing protein [Chloroflexota bacterium]|nr:DUF2283 domain-containing protein [Chloroflexota bacterium]